MLNGREMYKFPLCINFGVISLCWSHFSDYLGKKENNLRTISIGSEKENHWSISHYFINFPLHFLSSRLIFLE